MVSFEEKAKLKKAGNLNQGRSYIITTVISIALDTMFLKRLTQCLVFKAIVKGQIFKISPFAVDLRGSRKGPSIYDVGKFS